MSEWSTAPDAHLDPVVAAAYDRSTASEFRPDAIAATVDVLAELAHAEDQTQPAKPKAAEFAIGTGRVALPLHQRGVEVHGLDLSQPMLDQLNTKPNAKQIRTTLGDMTTTQLGDDFDLVYLVYNTITNLRSQDAQVACFQNAANHLTPGGRFVIKNNVPGLRNLPPGETIRPFHVSEEHLGFEEYVDLANQISISHHYHISDSTGKHPDGQRRVRTSSPSFRYVWPSELDLMARIANLELEHRWEGWTKRPFTGESTSHVSVWRKPPDRSA